MKKIFEFLLATTVLSLINGLWVAALAKGVCWLVDVDMSYYKAFIAVSAFNFIVLAFFIGVGMMCEDDLEDER